MSTASEVALVATNAGHVLLERKPDGVEWGLPRVVLGDGETAAAGLARLRARYGVVADPVDLGTREAGGVVFWLHRAPIPGLPEVPGHELRLVRLSFLPKELGAIDRSLLDVLLAP
jgi:hypothetical protein